MPLLPGLDIAASGMSAQRVRLNIVSSNLANAGTTRTEEGGPYRRKDPVFEAVRADGADQASFAQHMDGVQAQEALRGVRVAEVVDDTRPGRVVHDPDHPDADAAGNVEMPNVNVVEEMVNMITAARSFEANAQAFQSLRDMIDRSMDIGR